MALHSHTMNRADADILIVPAMNRAAGAAGAVWCAVTHSALTYV